MDKHVSTLENVGQERYCPRADSWEATWGEGMRPTAGQVCAECGAFVIYNPTQGEGPVRLVCLACVSTDLAQGKRWG